MELEELKKLPPEERIKKLQELEEKRKQEIKEAARLLQLSEEELVEEQKKKEDVERRFAPKLSSVDIEKLFVPAPKPVVEKKEEPQTIERLFGGTDLEELEKVIREEVPDMPEVELHRRVHYAAVDHFTQQSSYAMQQHVQDLYQEIMGQLASGGMISDAQRHQVYAIHDALQERHKTIQAGDYNPSAEARESLHAAGSMLKKIMGDYLTIQRPTW